MPQGPSSRKCLGGEPTTPPSTACPTLRVQVAVNHRQSREAIAGALFSTPGIIVHCSACGLEGATVAALVRPDVVVVGASRTPSPGSVVAFFRAAAPAAKIVLLRRLGDAGITDGAVESVACTSTEPQPVVAAVLAVAGRQPGLPDA